MSRDFDEKRWRREQDLDILRRAEEIKADPSRMAELERHLEEEREIFQSIHDKLFGPSTETSDEEEARSWRNQKQT